jgi:hypothetical protein
MLAILPALRPRDLPPRDRAPFLASCAAVSATPPKRR